MNNLNHQIFERIGRVMVPGEEDLCDGLGLKNGMIVLIEDSFPKRDPSIEPSSDYDELRLLENNRWCEVTELQVIDRVGEYGEPYSPLIKFIGVYADGTKMPRTYDSSYCWIYKLDGRQMPAFKGFHPVNRFWQLLRKVGIRKPYKGRVAYEWQIFAFVWMFRLKTENPKYVVGYEPGPVPVFKSWHVGRLHCWRDSTYWKSGTIFNRKGK